MFPELAKFVFLTGKREFGKTALTYVTAVTLADGGAGYAGNRRLGHSPAARPDPSSGAAI